MYDILVSKSCKIIRDYNPQEIVMLTTMPNHFVSYHVHTQYYTILVIQTLHYKSKARRYSVHHSPCSYRNKILSFIQSCLCGHSYHGCQFFEIYKDSWKSWRNFYKKQYKSSTTQTYHKLWINVASFFCVPF